MNFYIKKLAIFTLLSTIYLALYQKMLNGTGLNGNIFFVAHYFLPGPFYNFITNLRTLFYKL